MLSIAIKTYAATKKAGDLSSRVGWGEKIPTLGLREEELDLAK